jgi:hypothetical protein
MLGRGLDLVREKGLDVVIGFVLAAALVLGFLLLEGCATTRAQAVAGAGQGIALAGALYDTTNRQAVAGCVAHTLPTDFCGEWARFEAAYVPAFNAAADAWKAGAEPSPDWVALVQALVDFAGRLAAYAGGK